MDILGIGTAIIECPRIGKMVEYHGELFLRRVFTDREVRYCQSRKHAIEQFAGLWVAKEAILKAMGASWSRGVPWTDIEVRRVGGDSPKILVAGRAKEVVVRRAIGDLLISIAHCRTYATAHAMAVGPPGPIPTPPEAKTEVDPPPGP